jgi:hypothetical protein
MGNVEVKKSRTHGVGVFALKDFENEEIILDVDDSDVVQDTSALTDDDWNFNTDFLENGKVVWVKEPERAVNHSCAPNSYAKTINQVRRVVAMRRIKKGEEITTDYTINGYNDGTFECHCGSRNCRKTYQGNFFRLPRDVQIRYLPYLDEWFKREHRPEIQSLEGLGNVTVSADDS